MKKSFLRKVSVALILIMSMSYITGCNRKVKVDFGYDSSDYITELGTYKGVEYTPDNTVVTDRDVEKYIDDILVESTSWIEYFSAKVEEGDKVTIQFQANDENGTYLPEFSMDSDYDIVVGSGLMSKYYEGFEEELVGMVPGFTKKVECKVLEGFEEKEYVGKNIKFTISVIAGFKGNKPEYSNSFVKTHTGGAYKTTEAYNAYVKEKLEKELEYKKNEAKYAELIEKIMETTKVSSYPEAILNKQIKTTTESIKMYATLYGMTEEEYCKKQFDCTIEEYAKKVILQEMVLAEIAKREDYSVTTKEYKKNLDRVAKEAGFSSGEFLLEKYDKDVVYKYLLQEKAMKCITENAVAKEK